MKPLIESRQQCAAVIIHLSLIMLPPQSEAPPNSNRKNPIETIHGHVPLPAVTPLIILLLPSSDANRVNWSTAHDCDAVKWDAPFSNSPLSAPLSAPPSASSSGRAVVLRVVAVVRRVVVRRVVVAGDLQDNFSTSTVFIPFFHAHSLINKFGYSMIFEQISTL